MLCQLFICWGEKRTEVMSGCGSASRVEKQVSCDSPGCSTSWLRVSVKNGGEGGIRGISSAQVSSLICTGNTGHGNPAGSTKSLPAREISWWSPSQGKPHKTNRKRRLDHWTKIMPICSSGGRAVKDCNEEAPRSFVRYFIWHTLIKSGTIWCYLTMTNCLHRVFKKYKRFPLLLSFRLKWWQA